MQKITTFAELKQLLEEAKNGGHFTSVQTRTKWALNQYPTDGSERIKRTMDVLKDVNYTFPFAKSYAKDKAKKEGVNVDEVEIDNRRQWVHDVANVLKHSEFAPEKHYIIVMPVNSSFGGYVNAANGNALTDKEVENCKRYVSKAKKGETPEYLTISVSNIVAITFNHQTYSVAIKE